MIKNQKNLLPVSEPIISIYTKYASMTSILSVHDICHEWIYMNFLELIYIRDLVNKVFWYELRECDPDTVWTSEWEMCPYLETTQFKTSSIEYNGFIDYAIKNINQGKYIYLDLYAPVINNYHNKFKNNHDLLISGYDTFKGNFICSDYFDTKFSTQEVSFNEINNSFEKKREKESRADYNYLFAYKNVTGKQYTGNDLMIKIEKTINSKSICCLEPQDKHKVYFYSGIKTYVWILEDLKQGYLYYDDVRIFSVIVEHVKALNYLVHHFNMEIESYASKLTNIAEILVTLSLKYRFDQKEITKNKIENNLRLLYQNECNYLNLLCGQNK